jgi:hypothetical protein
MSENENGLVRKLSEMLPTNSYEGQAASILLGRQIRKGRQMEYAITLRPEDIPADQPHLKTWAGSQFIRFKDGGWAGEPGNLGATTILGQVLESALASQLQEDEKK